MNRKKWIRKMALALPIATVVSLAGCASAPLPSGQVEQPRPVTILEGAAAGGEGRFELTQPWQDAPEEGFRPGRVHLRWTPEAMIVEADLVDDHIMGGATGDQQRLWLLGDVFEIFIRREGREEYVEMQVCPNNHRLHLELPNARRRRTPDGPPLSVEEMLVHPPALRSTVSQDASGWRVKVEILPEAFRLARFEAGQEFRISFCRYDDAPGREPILSTTSPHPVVAFHRPEEWILIRL